MTINRNTYLIFADKSPEFPVALHYAARMAKAQGAHTAVIRVIEKQEFTHWGNIEERMREEQHKEAEQLVWTIARDIYEITGALSSIYIEEGDKYGALVSAIQNNPDIKMLILSADTEGPGPGPLISYFTGSKGLSQLHVPVLIIPSHISLENIENLT